MSFPEAVRSVLRKYVRFTGRAPRSEYWWWYLFTVLVNLVTNGIDRAVGNQVVGTLVSLGLLLPSLAVAVRRLHDSNLSGWWIVAPIVAVVGSLVAVIGAIVTGLGAAFSADNGTRARQDLVGVAIALGCVAAVMFLTGVITWLVLMLRASTPGTNRFGPDPRHGHGDGGYGYGAPASLPSYGAPDGAQLPTPGYGMPGPSSGDGSA